MTSLLGACLLSAAGFLPVHVLPVLVAVLVTEGRASITQAGWIGTAYMTGQLAVAIGLPAMRSGPFKSGHALIISIVLLTCLLWSGYSTTVGLIAAWFCIGAVSGALFYLGTLSAARFADVALAFSLRLSVSLLVGGIALITVQLLTGTATYLELIHGLFIGLAVILAMGFTLYRSEADALVKVPRPSGSSNGWVALSILYLLFVGQIGYWAFALQNSTDIEMPRDQAIGAIAGCKILAALIMWPLSYRERRQSISNGFLFPGIILAAGILIAVNAILPSIFMLGLLLWEVGFNVLSARLQTKAVQINPIYSGSWITATIFLGAAIGPAMQGHAMAYGLEAVFIAFAIGSALLPTVWEQYLRRAASAPATTASA